MQFVSPAHAQTRDGLAIALVLVRRAMSHARLPYHSYPKPLANFRMKVNEARPR